MHRKRSQHHSSSTIETPNTQSSQEDQENNIKMPCGFYGQVTYDEKLQGYVFIYTNARVPAESSIYVTFMILQKHILGTTQQLTGLN